MFSLPVFGRLHAGAETLGDTVWVELRKYLDRCRRERLHQHIRRRHRWQFILSHHRISI